MPTIDREAGFAVRIHLNDHGPAHVHVVRGGASAIIDLEDPPRVRVVHAMTFRDVRRAVTIVESRRNLYLSEWRRIHAGQEADG